MTDTPLSDRLYALAAYLSNTDEGEAASLVHAAAAELNRRKYDGVHTCSDVCERPACVLRRENERLREAMRFAVEIITDSWGEEQMESGDCQAVNVLRAALAGSEPDRSWIGAEGEG